jgi:hypothetical protein
MICQDALQGYVQNGSACPFPDTCSAGKCVNVVTLEAGNTKEENMLLLAEGMSQCWQKKGSQTGVCSGINTQSITYAIFDSEIEDWFCPAFKAIKDGNGSAADLSLQSSMSGTTWENMNDILGCDGGAFGLGNPKDLSIQGGNVQPGKDGIQCIGIAKDTLTWELHIAPCTSTLFIDLEG